MSVNGEVTQLLPKQVETAPQTERRSVGRGRRQSSCKGVPGAGCT